MSQDTSVSNGAESAQEIDTNKVLEAAVEQATELQPLPEAEDEKKIPTEAVEEEKKADDSEKDPFSSKFAALSRREKAIRKREKDLEARIKELEAKSSAPVESIKEELPLDVKLKKSPLETLQELGLPFDTLVKIALNDGKLPQDMQMQLMRQEIESNTKKELEALKSKLEEREKQEQAAKEQAALDSFKSSIESYVEQNSEQYELIKNNGAVDLVFAVIDEHFKQTEEVLEIKDACDLVEQNLEEEVKKHINLNKVKRLLSPQVSQSPEKAKASPKPSPTLSNEQAAQSVTGKKPFLSNEESLREAAKLIKWDAD